MSVRIAANKSQLMAMFGLIDSYLNHERALTDCKWLRLWKLLIGFGWNFFGKPSHMIRLYKQSRPSALAGTGPLWQWC